MTVSLPKKLIEEINRLAREEDRSRSNWLVRELKKIIAQKNAAKKSERDSLAAGMVVPRDPVIPASHTIVSLNETAPPERVVTPPEPKPPRMTKARAALRKMSQNQKPPGGEKS